MIEHRTKISHVGQLTLPAAVRKRFFGPTKVGEIQIDDAQEAVVVLNNGDKVRYFGVLIPGLRERALWLPNKLTESQHFAIRALGLFSTRPVSHSGLWTLPKARANQWTGRGVLFRQEENPNPRLMIVKDLETCVVITPGRCDKAIEEILPVDVLTNPDWTSRSDNEVTSSQLAGALFELIDELAARTTAGKPVESLIGIGGSTIVERHLSSLIMGQVDLAIENQK